jgi:hypothetical protein
VVGVDDEQKRRSLAMAPAGRGEPQVKYSTSLERCSETREAQSKSWRNQLRFICMHGRVLYPSLRLDRAVTGDGAAACRARRSRLTGRGEAMATEY